MSLVQVAVTAAAAARAIAAVDLPLVVETKEQVALRL
jgi:hypothetical protein